MIHGVTFEEQALTSANQAHYNYYFSGKRNGITKGCVISVSENSLSITAGYFIIYGRLVQLTGVTSVTAPEVSENLYARLVFEIDLSKSNTETEFNQGTFKILTSSTDFPALTQENLDEDGTVYQLPFAHFSLGQSGISNLIDDRNVFADRKLVTVPVSGWQQNANGWQQTIALEGVGADSWPTIGLYIQPGTAQSIAIDMQDGYAYITAIDTDTNALILTCAVDKPEATLTLAVKDI